MESRSAVLQCLSLWIITLSPWCLWTEWKSEVVYIAKIFWISVAYILLSSKKSLWQSEKNEKKWRFLKYVFGDSFLIWWYPCFNAILNCQSRFDIGYRMLGVGALGWPREMIWGGRWEGLQDWGLMYTRGGFMSMYGKANTVL